MLRFSRSCFVAIAAGVSALAQPIASHAHFLWIAADAQDAKSGKVVAFLNETPTPDLPEFTKYIAKATYCADGKPLSAEVTGAVYSFSDLDPAAKVVDGECDLGVSARAGTTMRLQYTGRHQRGVLKTDSTEPATLLRVAVVERSEGAKPALRAVLAGAPAANAGVKVFRHDGKVDEGTTDAQGFADLGDLATIDGVLVKSVDATPGKVGDDAFAETRYYATLTLGDAKSGPELVEAVTSFGAAVDGDFLYVYGGHRGKSHHYDTTTTSPNFRRINLTQPAGWEELPTGPTLQGVSLTSHAGKLYRIGGMTPKNEPGTPTDLVSTADAAVFDASTKTWTPLPALPEPRSTHDAVVVGDHLYVIGGWNMTGDGGEGSIWHDTALVLDLNNPQATWQELPSPPFVRRALAVATDGHKVYCVGGLTEESKVSTQVDTFDPATGTWAQVASIPGGKVQGFGPGAAGVGDSVFVTGGEGNVYRLDAKGGSWEEIGHLTQPRLMGRLVTAPCGDVLAVGGSVKMTATNTIETISMCAPADAGK